MNDLHTTTLVTDAVQPAPAGLGLHSLKVRLQIPHLRWIVAGLVCVSALTLGVMLLSNNGDWGLMNQRLFGQVQLTSGTFSAKSVNELNRLSWQWGLDTMDAMDALTAEITHVEAILATQPVDTGKLKTAQRAMARAEVRLDTLMSDKAKLLTVSHVFGQDQLYAPEVADSMFALQSHLAEVKTKLNEISQAQ